MPGLGRWGKITHIEPLGEKMARQTQERRKKRMEDRKDLLDIVEERRDGKSPTPKRKGYGRSFGISPRHR